MVLHQYYYNLLKSSCLAQEPFLLFPLYCISSCKKKRSVLPSGNFVSISFSVLLHVGYFPIQCNVCKQIGNAGYCGGIPIPRCWYWYSIVGSQKSSIPNTRPIPKFYMQICNQKPENIYYQDHIISYQDIAARTSSE